MGLDRSCQKNTMPTALKDGHQKNGNPLRNILKMSPRWRGDLPIPLVKGIGAIWIGCGMILENIIKFSK
jgi:hypothetical protein